MEELIELYIISLFTINYILSEFMDVVESVHIYDDLKIRMWWLYM